MFSPFTLTVWLLSLTSFSNSQSVCTDVPANPGCTQQTTNKVIFNQCTALTCRYPNYCVSESQCYCEQGYKQDPSNCFEFCSYKQKRKMLLLILEGVFMSGIGHFIAEKHIYALLKGIFFVFFYSILYLVYKNKNKNPRKANFVLGSLTVSYAVWATVDSIFIIFDFYRDGNDQPLY